MTTERENKARKFIASKLSDLFYIKAEVQGSWPIDGRTLRLDLLLRPNEKAKSLGLDVEAIGVETKDPSSKKSVKKLLDCDGVRPSFIVVYPEIEKFFEHDWIHKYSRSDNEKPTRREMSLLKRLIQRENVGEFIISKDQYTFNFASARFFDSKRGDQKSRVWVQTGMSGRKNRKHNLAFHSDVNSAARHCRR
jgi:hypothetical protein